MNPQACLYAPIFHVFFSRKAKVVCQITVLCEKHKILSSILKLVRSDMN